jgi:predicted transcriptional regulator of viral defense system
LVIIIVNYAFAIAITMRTSKLYSLFVQQGVFTLDEAQQKLGTTRHNLKVLIHHLSKSGIIGNIRRGLYYIVPIGQNRGFTPNPMVIASKLATSYYLGYHTALELHGVAYSAFHRVYVVTNEAFKPFEFRDITYVRVKPLDNNLEIGIECRKVEGNCVFASDRERTLIDGIDRLLYVGGIEEYLKSIFLFPSVDAEKIYNYLLALNRKVLFAKVGWVISMFRDKWKIDPTLFQRLKTHLSKRVVYLVSNQKVSKFQREWNIMVPANINELLQGV